MKPIQLDQYLILGLDSNFYIAGQDASMKQLFKKFVLLPPYVKIYRNWRQQSL